MKLRILPFILFPFFLASCHSVETGKSHGPIVLGDSSTIVTETDPKALQDEVQDLNPVIREGESDSTASATTTTDTAAAGSGNTSAQPTSGLVAAFKEVTINIPGITAKSFGKADLTRARGASFELSSGNIVGAQLRVSGGTVTRVSQRTQTMLELKDGSDVLVLESLPKSTSSWEELQGSAGNYAISGLDAGKLAYRMPSANALRNAVQQAARRQQLNRKDTQDWLDAARNVHDANTAPATVLLRSVMWRVEGKGFSKEVRLDVPLP